MDPRIKELLREMQKILTVKHMLFKRIAHLDERYNKLLEELKAIEKQVV
jgi:hypothetical protein